MRLGGRHGYVVLEIEGNGHQRYSSHESRRPEPAAGHVTLRRLMLNTFISLDLVMPGDSSEADLV
jgi:hypothetical protein